MAQSFLNRLLKRMPTPGAARHRHPRRRLPSYRPGLIELEHRTLLSTVVWQHPVDGDWDNPDSWLGGHVPTAADDAVIPFAGIHVTHAADAADAALTLASEAAVDLSAGSLAFGTTSDPTATNSRIDAPFTVTRGTLTLNRVVLNGAGTLMNRGTVNLFESTVNVGLDNEAEVVVATGPRAPSVINNQTGQPFANGPDATLTLQGNTVLIVANGFTNEGHIELQTTNRLNTELDVADGTLVNAPGATIDLRGDSQTTMKVKADLDNQGSISVGWGVLGQPGGTVINSGTIRVPQGALTVDHSAFTNQGTLSAGTLSVTATFTVSGGTFNQEGTFEGAGQLVLLNTTANYPGDVTNSVPGNLAILNTTFNSPGTLTNADTFLDITGSTINAAVVNQGELGVLPGYSPAPNAATVINGTLLNANPFAVVTVLASDTDIPASLTVTQGVTNEGRILLEVFVGGHTAELTVTGGTLTNRQGGIIGTLGTDGSMIVNAALDNQGTFFTNRRAIFTGSVVNSGIFSLGFGDLTVNLTDPQTPFANTGSMVIGDMRGLTLQGGDFLNAGSVTVFGTFLVSGSYTQQGGMTLLNGASLSAGALVDIQGGILAGLGTVNADLRNAAEVDVGKPGIPGTLVVNGNYTQTADATLRVQIGGPNAGADFDQLMVTGQTTLDGTLAVELINGFVPQPGDRFAVLTFGTSSGVFAAITGDGSFSPSYDPNDLTLVAN
jgi:hypothetical protein